MKKILISMLLLICVFSFSACSSGVSQSEYDVVCAQRDVLQEEKEILLAQIEELSVVSKEQEDAKKVLISGNFTAIVRGLIPDYSLDETTLNVAIINLFQCGPFAVYVGEEIAAELEQGEIYVFELMETEVEKVTDATDPETVIPLYHLRIKSVRLAEDDEWGMGDGTQIIYTELE